jgi:MFS family permease
MTAIVESFRTRSLSADGMLRLGIGAVYAAAAVPLFFIYNILPASLRQAGQPPEIANLVFLAYLPFALRAIWAPLVDRLGRQRAPVYRRIVLACLGLAALGIVSLLAFSPATGAAWITLAATALIVLIATATIALDGYLMAMLPAAERARSAALQGGGFALGGLAMGLGILACDGAGWHVVVWLLMAIMAVLALPALALPVAAPDTFVPEACETTRRGLWRFLLSASSRRRIGLALTLHGGLALAGGMLPVLQADAGLSLGQIALVSAAGSNGAGLIAAWATGLALPRIGAWRMAAIVGLASALGFGAIAFAAPEMGPAAAIALSLFVMALGYAFFVIFRALVLKSCGGPRGATQAASLSSLDAFVATVFAILAGLVIGRFGLPTLLVLSTLLCAAGVALAWRAEQRADEPDPTSR